MATINTTDEKFDEQVLKNEKPVLVDFWAEWCGPCKMVGPILEEISDEMSNDIVIAKHNIDSEPKSHLQSLVSEEFQPCFCLKVES